MCNKGGRESRWIVGGGEGRGGGAAVVSRILLTVEFGQIAGRRE